MTESQFHRVAERERATLTLYLDGQAIEARRGVTTGISAADRAATIRVAVDERSGPSDIVMPPGETKH